MMAPARASLLLLAGVAWQAAQVKADTSGGAPTLEWGPVEPEWIKILHGDYTLPVIKINSAIQTWTSVPKPDGTAATTPPPLCKYSSSDANSGKGSCKTGTSCVYCCCCCCCTVCNLPCNMARQSSYLAAMCMYIDESDVAMPVCNLGLTKCCTADIGWIMGSYGFYDISSLASTDNAYLNYVLRFRLNEACYLSTVVRSPKLVHSCDNAWPGRDPLCVRHCVWPHHLQPGMPQ